MSYRCSARWTQTGTTERLLLGVAGYEEDVLGLEVWVRFEEEGGLSEGQKL